MVTRLLELRVEELSLLLKCLKLVWYMVSVLWPQAHSCFFSVTIYSFAHSVYVLITRILYIPPRDFLFFFFLVFLPPPLSSSFLLLLLLLQQQQQLMQQQHLFSFIITSAPSSLSPLLLSRLLLRCCNAFSRSFCL